MTEVYQSVSTTNEVEDRYAKNETARKVVLGPLSVVIKCIGFDQTYSLFKKETRGRVISWISTPLAVMGAILLLVNMMQKFEHISHFLTWHWGEMMCLTFLGMQSFASAVCLIRQTDHLYYLTFYESWTECTRLAEKEKKVEDKENGKENREMENGESDGYESFSSPRNTASPIKVILALIIFAATSIAYSTKYAVYHGHNGDVNSNVTKPLTDKFETLEPLLCLWASLVSATALCVYGVLHGIMQDTIDEFNKDLKSSSEKRTLAAKIDYFSTRQQAVLGFARVLSNQMGGYATYCVKPAVVVNFSAMFLSLAFKGFIGPLGYVCIVLWTIVAIASKIVVLFQAAAVQEKLNESSEILIGDKEIWNGDLAVAQQAHIMLTKRKSTDTTVVLLKCLRISPWVANGLMLLPPILGGILTIMKVFFFLRLE